MVKSNKTVDVKGTEIVVYSHGNNDYISLTDMAKYRSTEDPSRIISLWMRTFTTIEFIGIWERINNPNFKPLIFEGFKNESARPSFWMSPQKWIKDTGAIGFISKSGRYGGGTFAHYDIALEFASWISSEFKLYLITEFKRLKTNEQQKLSAEWNLQRTISKINYHIHTDAIKEHIVPNVVSKKQIAFTYANEADLLNVALFGKTAAEWRAENPDADGNIRDFATLEQLVVLSNLESINAVLIRQNLPQNDRLVQLNSVAITQLQSLVSHEAVKRLR